MKENFVFNHGVENGYEVHRDIDGCSCELCEFTNLQKVALGSHIHRKHENLRTSLINVNIRLEVSHQSHVTWKNIIPEFREDVENAVLKKDSTCTENV